MKRALTILVATCAAALARPEDAEPVIGPFDLPPAEQQEDPDRILVLPELGISISRAEVDQMITRSLVACLAAEAFLSEHKWPTSREELTAFASTKDVEYQKAIDRCHALAMTVVGPELHVRYLDHADDSKSAREFVLKPGESVEAIVTEALFKKEGEPDARPNAAEPPPQSGTLPQT